VPFRGGEIHEAALAEDDDAPAVTERELLDEWPKLDRGLWLPLGIYGVSEVEVKVPAP